VFAIAAVLREIERARVSVEEVKEREFGEILKARGARILK